MGLDFALALTGVRSRPRLAPGALVPGPIQVRSGPPPGPVPVAVGEARLLELRLEPGPRPRLHLRVTHPVHREVVITIVALPTGVHLEVRCDRPEQLARRWPRGSRRLRVRFVRTPSDGPALARRQPAI